MNYRKSVDYILLLSIFLIIISLIFGFFIEAFYIISLFLTLITFFISLFTILYKWKSKIKVSNRSSFKSNNNEIVAEKMESCGRIVSRFSHDINNIIHAIVGYSELIAEDESLTDEIKEFIQEIINSTENASDFITKIQHFSREREIFCENMNLRELVTNAHICANNNNNNEKTVDFSIEIEPNATQLFCNYKLFEMALCEIFKNAIEHNYKKHINITVHANSKKIDSNSKEIQLIKDGEYIELTIKNDGILIDKSIRRKIFDPYFSTIDNQKKGIGLAIAYTSIMRHDGFLELVEDNKNTTFRMLLPKNENKF